MKCFESKVGRVFEEMEQRLNQNERFSVAIKPFQGYKTKSERHEYVLLDLLSRLNRLYKASLSIQRRLISFKISFKNSSLLGWKRILTSHRYNVRQGDFLKDMSSFCLGRFNRVQERDVFSFAKA